MHGNHTKISKTLTLTVSNSERACLKQRRKLPPTPVTILVAPHELAVSVRRAPMALASNGPDVKLTLP